MKQIFLSPQFSVSQIVHGQMRVINGSGNLDRIKRSIEALDIRLSTEQWQRILVASRGVRLP